MIEKIFIKNYKSVKYLELELGRVNVLIGENGCGKTNILEAVALASAAAEGKLDNEFLTNRGIRVSEPVFMRSAFEESDAGKPIEISVSGRGVRFESVLENDNKPYSRWKNRMKLGKVSDVLKYLEESKEKGDIQDDDVTPETFRGFIDKRINDLNIRGCMIYSPERSEMRASDKDVPLTPLGTKGQGLLTLLRIYNAENREKITQIKKELGLIDWFEDLDIPEDFSEGSRIRIKDTYLDERLPFLSHKDVNEGFLFLLFYITLFVSQETPSLLAIDNIDASLNPGLCTELIRRIRSLAERHDKQVILTSHNPAVLDGLNLNDTTQRLFVVSRNKVGHTKIREVRKPLTATNEEPVKLSEAFLGGMLGGLPKSF